METTCWSIRNRANKVLMITIVFPYNLVVNRNPYCIHNFFQLYIQKQHLNCIVYTVQVIISVTTPLFYNKRQKLHTCVAYFGLTTTSPKLCVYIRDVQVSIRDVRPPTILGKLPQNTTYSHPSSTTSHILSGNISRYLNKC